MTLVFYRFDESAPEGQKHWLVFEGADPMDRKDARTDNLQDVILEYETQEG